MYFIFHNSSNYKKDTRSTVAVVVLPPFTLAHGLPPSPGHPAQSPRLLMKNGLSSSVFPFLSYFSRLIYIKRLTAASIDFGLHLLTKSSSAPEHVFPFGGGLSGHHGKINDMVFCGGWDQDSARYVATVSGIFSLLQLLQDLLK